MNPAVNLGKAIDWLLGLLVLALAVAHAWWVHPVPGLVCGLLALLFFPPVNALLRASTGLSIPRAVKLALFVAIIWFTLGVSDLGDLID